jgi:hypothetical protein
VVFYHGRGDVPIASKEYLWSKKIGSMDGR